VRAVQEMDCIVEDLMDEKGDLYATTASRALNVFALLM
jgi:hypothetical protein